MELKKQFQKIQDNPYTPVAFFIVGFVFDIILLDRIDGIMQFLQIIAYTGILTILVRLAILEKAKFWIPQGAWLKYWKYNEFIIHFLLGALLNLYSIFYFKSASILASIIFFGVIIGLLLANEFLRTKRFQHLIIFTLYYVCLVSFWIAFVPIALGFIGLVPFLVGLGAAGATIWLFDLSLKNKLIASPPTHQATQQPTHQPPLADPVNSRPVNKSAGSSANQRPLSVRQFNFRIGGAVIIFFLASYIFQIIPPVPLSINYMGIFHEIKKDAGQYQLLHYKPVWRFWETGDQQFLAREGDKIVSYVEIFAPNKFKDEIRFTWYLKTKNGWSKQDSIPFTIVGGRDQGFRGYSIKQNYQPGNYRIVVETTDAREIGRIGLTVTKDLDILPRNPQFIHR